MPDQTASSDARQAPRTTYLKDYQSPAYDVEFSHFEFDLAADKTQVRSVLGIKRNSAVSGTPPLVLNGHELELVSVHLNGTQLTAGDYRLEKENLSIDNPPEKFELALTVQIAPAQNTALEGLYASGSMLCTQCEAEGFRRITFYPDRPDVMSRYRVKMMADKTIYPVLLSNGNLVETGNLENNRHYAVWEDPSLKPSYLFALVAGNLAHIADRFTTLSGREVTLRLYTEKENADKCEHAMNSLKQAMRWDEETYGREYDLDIYMVVAVNDFNMGAMENKGLNVFNASCVLASPETATDFDYYTIQSIIGHEYFHNWSGNRVTCRDWFQLSLKEGFTVFRDQEFSADLNSRVAQRIADVDILRLHQFAEDSGPMAHPVRPDHYIEISNFYTVTVYNKGAEVVRMLKNLLGWEGFRRGTDLYFNRHDGQAVTCDDFVKALEDANGVDLNQFKRWYSQAGTPILSIKENYDADAARYTLTVQQETLPTPGQKEKQPFHIPLTVALLNSAGEEMPLLLQGGQSSRNEQVLELREEEQSFVFEQVNERPLPSLLRGFSAPLVLDMTYSEEQLAFLAAHDTDDFNRWEATQKLALTELLKQIEAFQNGMTLPTPVILDEVLGKALNDPAMDKTLLAKMLSLPSENYIAGQCEVIDVEAIHEAVLFTRRYLARTLYGSLLQQYQDNYRDTAYVFNHREMARRELRNACLSYLTENAGEEDLARCYGQFKEAGNLTESGAALRILIDYDTPLRQQALEAFYSRWKDDKQMMEKWLEMQAKSRLPNTLGQVKALMQHPVFSLNNPNKVRSLIRTFCRDNPVNFHRGDGAAYVFLADVVLQLDQSNPQIAARMVQAMNNWKRHEPVRRDKMREQLQRILENGGLSKDTYEVVSKALA